MASSAATDDADASLDSSHGLAERAPQLPGGTALQGHLRDLASDNFALFKRCAAQGGLVRFRVYWYQCHVLTDPELAGALLVTHAASFQKTRGLQVARPTFGNGLVTSEGDEWRRQQRLMRAYFTPKAAASYAELIDDCIERKLTNWDRAGGVVDLHEDMVDVSLELVCRALFGLDAGRLQSIVRDAAQAVQQWHSDCQALCLPYPHYFPIPSNYRYRKRTRALNRAVYALIRDVRASGGAGHGLLGALLNAKDEEGNAISDQELRDQIVTLFLAGHDTTASSLALTLYELSYRPDLQQQIAQELQRGEPSECLEHVLKETLRLYPAVHLVGRTALADVKLGKFLIRRGEEVILPLQVMQRNPRLFSRPDEFVPERWAGLPPTCPRYAHLPFSTGPRVCIGQALAMAELRGIVAATLRRFRLKPLGKRAPRLENRMTLAPAPGMTRVAVSRV
jgi:cytochrome P450